MAPRPYDTKDLITATNGDPIYLGSLVSTGAAVNNRTTVTPFNQTAPQGDPTKGPLNLAGTLAGKTLLLQTTAAGLISTSNSPSMVINGVPNQSPIIAQQSVMPPVAGTVPGVALVSGERVELIMMPLNGWLQWLPVSGSANLHVWELR